MKAKLFILGLLAGVFVACNESVGDASLVEGAWELQQVESDKSVYADQTGATHVSDKPYFHLYTEKEMVWLFNQKHISWWKRYEGVGELFMWDCYLNDAEISYSIEGEGKNMVIIQTARSIIPSTESAPSITHFKVEELSKRRMVLSTTSTPYISELDSTIQVQERYTFKRENTLMDYINYIQEPGYDVNVE